MLQSMKKPLGIYVHIPFCIKKCDYCDFVSFEAEETLIQDYTEALLTEIRSYEHIKSGHATATVFFGGGTPSMLNEKQLTSILDEVKKVFCLTNKAEITIECNPGTLDKKKLKAYYDAGINRVSIGLQTVISDELKILGRIHDYTMFYNNYIAAREIGFNNINIDLIFAVPGQTYESFMTTLKTVTELNPEHISTYSLIIEEGTKFYKLYDNKKNTINNLLLPDEEEERKIDKAIKKQLEKEGYHRYEISNYAKEGYECRHNRFYWDRTEYIGLGLSASSFYMDERFKNTNNIKEYINNSRENKFLRNYNKISRKEAIEEYMYLGLRMCEGVSISNFYEQFNESIFNIYGDVIEKMKMYDCMNVNNDRISLTDKGMDVSNLILCEFLIAAL